MSKVTHQLKRKGLTFLPKVASHISENTPDNVMINYLKSKILKESDFAVLPENYKIKKSKNQITIAKLTLQVARMDDIVEIEKLLEKEKREGAITVIKDRLIELTKE